MLFEIVEAIQLFWDRILLFGKVFVYNFMEMIFDIICVCVCGCVVRLVVCVNNIFIFIYFWRFGKKVRQIDMINTYKQNFILLVVSLRLYINGGRFLFVT